MRENLWAHTLGLLNVLILSEAVIEVSGPEFDSKTLQPASHWINMLKGPNVCAQRFSRISSLCRAFVHERENLWVSGYHSHSP